MILKVRDRVKITDSNGVELAMGTIVNVNDCREPSMKYAVVVDGYSEDVLFLGGNKLIKMEECKNE